MATFLTYLTNLSDNLNEDYSKWGEEGRWQLTTRHRAINSVLRSLYAMDWYWTIEEATLTFTDGEADFPADFGGQILGVWWGAKKTPEAKIGSMTVLERAQADLSSTASNPEYHYVEGDKIKCYPKASGSGILSYKIAANTLAADDDVPLNMPSDFDDYVDHGASMLAWLWRNDVDMYRAFKTLADSEMDRLEEKYDDIEMDRVKHVKDISDYAKDNNGRL